MRSTVWIAIALTASLAAPVAAGVKVTRREDGPVLIHNEGKAQRARRLSTRMMPLPDQQLEPLIDRHARAQRLEPRLVRAVIQAESGYNARAISNKGAMGLMQLMPDTAADLEVEDPFDPGENVRGGTAYLRWLLDRFEGRLELALAAYNAGPGAVERHEGIPPYAETRRYVRKVLALYRGREPTLSVAEVRRGRQPTLVRREGQRPLLTTDPPR